ncbi:MAG: glucose 1-dehydrogenase [Thermoleophilia bacterium]|nr:glucose 1-dehydrogenase [Thermoleophilia bacterium]
MSLEQFDIAGQAVIITGASSGLGQIMARGYAAAGCHLVIAARRTSALEELASEIQEDGTRVVVRTADVRDPGHADALVDLALAEFDRLDGAVLNAGIATVAPAQDESLEDFAAVMEVNVTAQMRLAQAAARAMIPRGGGWIIALSSILGNRAGTGGGVSGYTASKGAIEQLTRELARQWAPHGIRVNALSPGFFPTEMNAPLVASPERLAAMLARIPLGRMGEQQDLIGAAVFLASPAARYVTGHSLAVDGGMSAW